MEDHINNSSLKSLTHKKEVDINDWDKVHKNLRILAYELIEYCESRNLPIVITSIIRPMIPGVSKTDIHAKGRAFDVSTNGWSLDGCIECQDYFNNNYQSIGAIGLTDGKTRAALFESPSYNNRGTASHFHFQVRS